MVTPAADSIVTKGRHPIALYWVFGPETPECAHFAKCGKCKTRPRSQAASSPEGEPFVRAHTSDLDPVPEV